MIKKSLLALLSAYLFCVFIPVVLHLLFEDTSPPSDSYFTESALSSTLLVRLFLSGLVIIGFLLRNKIVALFHFDEVIFFHFLTYLLFYNIVAAFIVVKDKKNQLVYSIEGARKIKDSIYGYRYPSNATRHEIVRNADTVLFEATYTFDALGRRITYAPANHKSKSVLFFGCSFTYGDGVNNEETFPSQYAILDSSVNVYNYAIDGWGPQQTFLQIDKRKLSVETQSDTAIGVYVWIDDHIKRASLYKSHYQGWTQFFPCFVIENKSLVNRGSFEKTYPFKGFFFELLNNSLFFKHIEIPTHETEKDRALAVALLQASKTAFLKSFKHGKFVVFLYPGSNEALVPYLKSNGIDYVVGDKNVLTTSDFIPKHEHPNKYANQKVAYALQQYLQRQ